MNGPICKVTHGRLSSSELAKQQLIRDCDVARKIYVLVAAHKTAKVCICYGIEPEDATDFTPGERRQFIKCRVLIRLTDCHGVGVVAGNVAVPHFIICHITDTHISLFISITMSKG